MLRIDLSSFLKKCNMWSNHPCLKSKPFHMHPWPSAASLILQPVYSYIPFAQPALSYQNICTFWKMPYTFCYCTFLSCGIVFGIPPSFLISHLSSRSSLTLLGKISYHLFCPYMALCLFFWYSTYQMMISYLFTYLSPLIDCGQGSGSSLCFIHSVASELGMQ